MFLLKVALPGPQLTPHSFCQFLLQMAVILNLPAYFHDLLPGHIEGTAAALFLPIEVKQRSMFLPTLAAAARFSAIDVLLNQ